MSGNAPLKIEYASTDASRRSGLRRVIRVGLLLAVLGGAASIAIKQIPSIWAYLSLRYYERQCAQYAQPPELVIFAEDPAAVAKLSGKMSYAIETREVDPPTALYQARCLNELEQWTAPTNRINRVSATIFLHELQTPKGERRLARITYAHCLEHSAGTDSFYFDAATLNPNSKLKESEWQYPDTSSIDQEIGRIFSARMGALPGYLTIFAGQTAPNDPSRFSIRCTFGFREAFIDGQLVDGPQEPILLLNTRSGYTIPPKLGIAYSQQMEQYAPPPSQVVFEDDPPKAAKLLASGDYFDPHSPPEKQPCAARKVPSFWQDSYIPTHITIEDPNVLQHGKEWFEGPVLFLGGRSTGKFNRIVRVDLRSSQNSQDLMVSVLSTATVDHSPKVIGGAQREINLRSLRKLMRFYAGQRDPLDASHFTIGYEYDGKTGNVDGWLLSDGVTVRFAGWPERSDPDNPREVEDVGPE
jgi:hypothetical protein